MAEPSVMVILSRHMINLLMAHSKNTQARTDVAKTMAAPTPKKYNDANKAGTSAMHTPYMFFCTLSVLCT